MSVVPVAQVLRVAGGLLDHSLDVDVLLDDAAEPVVRLPPPSSYSSSPPSHFSGL